VSVLNCRVNSCHFVTVSINCKVTWFVVSDIVDNRIAHFFLLHEDVSLQYFMPVVST